MKLKALAFAALSATFASTAFAAPSDAMFQKLKLTHKANSPMVTCLDKNAALDREVDAAFELAKKAGQIDKAEAAHFAAMEARIAAHRKLLERDKAYTLAECNTMTKDFEAEKAAVTKMGAAAAAALADLGKCKANFDAAYGEVASMIEKAKKAGKLNPTELASLKASDEKLAKEKANAAKGGVTPAECKSLLASVAAERTKVVAFSK